MKIQHSDKRTVGRPSFRTLTARIAPSHAAVTFSSALVRSIGINSQSTFAIVEHGGSLLMSVDAESKYKVKEGKAGIKGKWTQPEFRCSCKALVLMLLNHYQRTKVVTLAVGAAPISINGTHFYKLIAETSGF